MKERLVKIAVIIPVLGLMALMARAEFAVRSGPTWRIDIEGYDPRDLLHGRFLRYRYKLNWQGENTCGSTEDGGNGALSPGCCLCLTRDDADGINPPVRQVWCDEAQQDCDGWLRADALEGAQRYFVPEDRARELEEALRDREAALELTCSPDGTPAIRELYLDGRPWRETLGE